MSGAPDNFSEFEADAPNAPLQDDQQQLTDQVQERQTQFDVPGEEPTDRSQPPQGYVPQTALHETRRRLQREEEARRVVEQRLNAAERDYQTRMSLMEQRMQLIAQAAQRMIEGGQQQQEPQITPLEEDPVEHFRTRLELSEREKESLNQRLSALEQTQHQQRNMQHQEAQIRRVFSAVDVDQQNFAQQVPDYYDAVEHLRGMADRELQLMGMNDPLQRKAAVQQQMNGIMAMAIQSRRSPAQTAYELARSRGYRGQFSDQGGGGEPRFERPQQQQQQLPRSRYQPSFEDIERGRQAAGGSIGRGGGRPPGRMSIEAIANMPEEQFSRVVKNPNELKRLLGG